MISKIEFQNCAKALDVDLATIMAVAEVESAGNGFLESGVPKILFEPHVFWKQLKAKGLNPLDYAKGNEDILYPVYGSKPYGDVASQHGRLTRACKINREAALRSASWGAFQIMGYNFYLCGFMTLQAFINAMYAGQDEHLRAFTGYILKTGLDDELRNKAWAQFAVQYNGPLYMRNKYDVRLKAAYKKFCLNIV